MHYEPFDPTSVPIYLVTNEISKFLTWHYLETWQITKVILDIKIKKIKTYFLIQSKFYFKFCLVFIPNTLEQGDFQVVTLKS